MKRRRLVIAAAVLLVAFLAVLLSRSHEYSARISMRPSGTPENSTAASSPSPVVVANTTRKEQQQVRQDRAQTIRSAIEGTNVPINFWGKVVDQNGKPIAGVNVSYSRQTERPILPGVPWANSQVHKEKTITDGNGNFSITGMKGHYLAIEGFNKNGYRMPEQFVSARASYDYFGSGPSGKFTPDKERPVEFLMIEEKTGRDLVVYNKRGTGMRIPADGTPVRWNLWTGKSDPVGELQIVFHREPTTSVIAGQAVKWDAKVEVVGGAVTEAAYDEMIWKAPTDGYRPVVDYPKNEQRRGTPSRAFYIKTADGKYGRVHLDLYPYDDGATVRMFIRTWMNPEPSSRSLVR